jgi:UDP-glucose 4-epimerase
LFEKPDKMKILVTGSAGHLGEALLRVLRERGTEAYGMDRLTSPFTDGCGSIEDRQFVKKWMRGITHVLHTATLHKPHISSHDHQQFIETNIIGTLNLLEEAAREGVKSFIFTSTTSTFGDALTPDNHESAAWITEEVVPIPKNIYGVTKVTAEDLCQLFHRNKEMACIVLRTSRFFPEVDDEPMIRDNYADANVKVNEYLYRRVDMEDVVDLHLLALEKAPNIGFGRYIVSATSPFKKEDLRNLKWNAHQVVNSLYPNCKAIYARLGWEMFPTIGRVYVNQKAREEFDWNPKYDFGVVLDRLEKGLDFRSDLSIAVGSKGYHR